MGDLEVHPKQLRATRDDEPIELSLREIKILQLLFNRAGQVVDRQELMNYAWGQDYLPYQPYARSACLAASQTNRARSETTSNHSNGPWSGYRWDG